MDPAPYFLIDPRNNRIKLRQNHIHGRQLLSIGEKCSAKEWNKKKNRPKDFTQAQRLDNLLLKLSKLEKILMAKGYNNPPLRIVWDSQFEAVEPDAPSSNSIVDWCNWKASLGNGQGFLNIVVHLQEWKRSSALLVNLNESWVRSYCRYLSQERGMKTSSISKSVAYLRNVVNSARLNNQPVGVIPVRLGKAAIGGKSSLQKMPLDLGELMRWKELTGLPRHLESIRDMFLIMCFTGVRISDLLDPAWVVYRDRIINTAAKTGRAHAITLNSISRQTIEKYATTTMNGEWKLSLPVLEGQYLNRQYKKLAKMAYIKKNVTNHVARHSFSRLLSDMGLNEGLRAAELGHAGRTVTSGYGVHDADSQVKLVSRKWEKVLGMWTGDYEQWFEAVNE